MKLYYLALASLLFIAACTNSNVGNENPENNNQLTVSWQEIKLRDVNTGNVFRISDFKGKPVLLESFAVWCPTCKKQQDKILELHDKIGDDVISISLDTDPNENEKAVREFAKKNGFTWHYAVSPVELTQELIDEFGVGFVNAPSAPVVLICEDGSSRFLKNGVKSADTLKQEIAKGCTV